MAQCAGNAHWAEPSPLFAHRARPTPLKCKNEYPMLPLREETAVQAVVASIVWAFRRFKTPRSREMSARGYALHSVRPKLLFPFPQKTTHVPKWERVLESQKRVKCVGHSSACNHDDDVREEATATERRQRRRSVGTFYNAQRLSRPIALKPRFGSEHRRSPDPADSVSIFPLFLVVFFANVSLER